MSFERVSVRLPHLLVQDSHTVLINEVTEVPVDGGHESSNAEAAEYDDETIERVGTLLQKRNLRTDADVQTLEDAAALVFLDHHLDDFLQRDDIGEDKAIDIIRKTWKKMTDRGHEAAAALALSPESTALLEKALAG